MALSFTPKIENYGALTLENVTISPAPQITAGAVLPPPPNNEEFLNYGPLSSMQPRSLLQQSRLVPRPAWAGWFTQIRNRVQFSSSSIAIQFECPSVDETDIQWFGVGTMPASGDTYSFNATIYGSSRWGRTFAAGDYIVWNNGTQAPNPITGQMQYSYEINQIISVVGTTFTVQRRPKNGIQGFGYFGSLQVQQDQISFWRLVDQIFEVPYSALNGPQVFELPWANKCVCAVVGSFAGSAAITTNCYPFPPGAGTLSPPSPGLRTLDGAQYILGRPGDVTAGDQSVLQIQVAGPESIRSVQAACTLSGGIALSVMYTSTQYSNMGIGLVDLVSIPAGDFYSYSAINAPERRRQMPYHSGWTPPDVLNGESWPPAIMPLVSGISVGYTVDPTHYVVFEEGGYLDFIVTSGSATDLVVMVQT